MRRKRYRKFAWIFGTECHRHCAAVLGAGFGALCALNFGDMCIVGRRYVCQS